MKWIILAIILWRPLVTALGFSLAMLYAALFHAVRLVLWLLGR